MALNKIFAETQSKNRERLLSLVTVPDTPPTSVASGTPVIFAEGSAVSLTASGGHTSTETLSDGSTVTFPDGGVGNATGAASFAFDGTWEFAVTGALTTTASDVAVYMVPADGTLTLTVGTNILYGYTDYPRDYTKTAGIAPVRIGA